MKWTDSYKCSHCGATWEHEWDTDDYSNDYTLCPVCNSVDFEGVEYENQ